MFAPSTLSTGNGALSALEQSTGKRKPVVPVRAPLNLHFLAIQTHVLSGNCLKAKVISKEIIT